MPSLSNPRPNQSPRGAARQALRQAAEVLIIALVAAAVQRIWSGGLLGPGAICGIVVAVAIAKTAWFLTENLQHILLATSQEIPYHRFLGLMGVNMMQVTLSFALDFWILESAERGSFSGFDAALSSAQVFFDCFVFSVLNFTFFGFGDILPRTVAAKIVTLLEVVLAFFTVIFLLSDFISLKDSLRRERGG